MELEIITLQPHNRMLRLGFGKHKHLWFIRIDLWFKGIRLKQSNDMICKECNIPYEFDWIMEYNTCPRCGSDIENSQKTWHFEK